MIPTNKLPQCVAIWITMALMFRFLGLYSDNELIMGILYPIGFAISLYGYKIDIKENNERK